MVTINGYTAERMKEIEDSSITDANVVGDDLILTKFDGTTINAGNVRGPAGEEGEFAAQLAAALKLADPPGTPKPYTGAVVPDGHGLCDAATEYSSATYPDLAALYGTGAGCINGASTVGTFRLPNLKGKTLFGRDAAVAAFDTLHETGGTKDAVVVTHNHTATSDQPGHTHTGTTNSDGVDHVHTTQTDGEHSHGIDGDDPGADRIAFTHASSHATVFTATSPDDAQEIAYGHLDEAGTHDHGNTFGASAFLHTHGFTTSNEDPAITTTVNNNGVSGTDKNLPPYRVINWIMRLA